jgi:xanthine dehydrogenase YagS FAD-binding subunit
MNLPNFTFIRPKSITDAVSELHSPKARIHAGGTDLLGCLRDGVFGAEKLVSIGHLDKLKGFDRTQDGGVRIGALTRIAELAASDVIRQSYPALARSAAEVASPQLRNQGTLGGNLCQKPRCWYYRGEFNCLRKGGDKCYAYDGENQYHCIFDGSVCFITHPSDIAPALVAYDAVIRVAGEKGFREVPAGKFHILPEENVEKETVLTSDEIVTEIFLPSPRPGLLSSYRKVRARGSWDFALAGVALALKFQEDVVEEARIVLSGAAPIPWRSREMEEFIIRKKIDRETAARAAERAVKEAQPLKKNGYKVTLFRGMIEEELLKISKA